ncbi:hypothetical protein KKG63_03525 [Patescibacteria group bacterium]|nr:hypothetical protein [Patescibacteria group bacterium]
MAEPIITIEYGINYSSSYILEVNPWPVTIETMIFESNYRQSEGTLINYRQAKKYSFAFSWEQIPQAMYNNLKNIKATSGRYRLTLQNMTPSGIFYVLWKGNMSNRYWRPLVGSGFTGKMELEEV